MPLINFTNIEAAIFGEKLLWTILEEQFPVPRNTAASEIGNGVISLLWQLRCHCNPDDNNFYLYLIQLWWQLFQISVYGDVWRWPNLGGIDHEKLYRATLNLSRGGILCRQKQQSWIAINCHENFYETSIIFFHFGFVCINWGIYTNKFLIPCCVIKPSPDFQFVEYSRGLYVK